MASINILRVVRDLGFARRFQAGTPCSSRQRRRRTAPQGLSLANERLEVRCLLTATVDSAAMPPDMSMADEPASQVMAMDGGLIVNATALAADEVTWGYGLTDPGQPSAWDITGMPLGEFHTRLNFVKRATVDPLLAPGNPDFWHAHDFFVNPSVNENSTLTSLMEAGASDAAPASNLSVYWVPSLFNETTGSYVDPLDSSIAYYSVQKPLEPSKIEAMPAGLSIIAGNAMPSERQSTGVVFWNYIGTSTQYDHIPQGDEWQDLPLQAVVMFPQFWDGESLTGRNFKDHMAYDRGGDGGPSSHPYLLPELQLQIHYGRIPRDANLVLTSDSMTADRPGYAPGWSMHADFIHTPWPEVDAAGNLYDGFERRVNDALRWPTVAGVDGNAARPNPNGLQQPFTPAPIVLDPILPGSGQPATPPDQPDPPPSGDPAMGPDPAEPTPPPPSLPPRDLPVATPGGPDLKLAWPTPDVVMLTGVEVGIHGTVTDADGVASLRLALRHESGSYWRPDGSFGDIAWHNGSIVASDGHWRLMFAPAAPGTYSLLVAATDGNGNVSIAETRFDVIGDTLVPPPAGGPALPPADVPVGENPPVTDAPPAVPSDPPAAQLTVADREFWESTRGIGFSVGSLGSLPDQTRLESSLQKVVDLGFTMIRTWGTGDYTGRILEAIDRLRLPLKVQVGVYITADAEADELIEHALEVIAAHREHVLAVSLGNEQLADWNSSDLSVDDLLRQVAFFRQRSDLPLTYNFSGETFRSWSSFWPQDGSRLLEAIDYINVHSYAGFFDNRFNPTWTPDRQLAVLQQDEAALAAVLADLGMAEKPLVLGETGWQAAGYDARVTNPQNMQAYYEAVTRYVYGPAARFDSMFYFNLTDEAWKGGDDRWGLFAEGTATAIGATKFALETVPEILAEITPPPAPGLGLEVVATTTDVSLLVEQTTGLAFLQDAGGDPIAIRRADGYWNGDVPLSRGGATLRAAARDDLGRLRVLDVGEWGAFAWILDETGLFIGEEGPGDTSLQAKETLFQLDLDGDGIVGPAA